MATRASILFYDEDTQERIYLYRNYDGYREGTGESLERIKAMVHWGEIPSQVHNDENTTMHDVVGFMVYGLKSGMYKISECWEDFIDWAYVVNFRKVEKEYHKYTEIEINSFERGTKFFKQLTGIED